MSEPKSGTDPRIAAAEIVIGDWFNYEPYTCTDLAEQIIEAIDAADPQRQAVAR